MAIAITSDLVSDVLNAANPQRVRMARVKLGDETFGVAMQKVESGGNRVRDLNTDLVLDVVRAADPTKLRAGAARLLAAADAPDTKAYAGLEAFVLGQMMETMLPKSDGGAFGQGTAGGIWRSFMASELGNSLSASGGLGIAGMLAGEADDSTTALNEIKPAQGWPYFTFTPRADSIA
jgi:peptidoglycan hydrolase FlgJ